MYQLLIYFNYNQCRPTSKNPLSKITSSQGPANKKPLLPQLSFDSEEYDDEDDDGYGSCSSVAYRINPSLYVN